MPSNEKLMATHEVLSTPELLEQILINIPAPKILTNCIRVCWTWRSLVEGPDSSPTIRRKLFLPTKEAARIPSPDPLYPYYPETIHPIDLSRVLFPMPVENAGPRRFKRRFRVWREDLEEMINSSRRSSSWLGMHVSRPPITTMTVHRNYQMYASGDETGYAWGDFCALRVSKGITFMDIVALLLRLENQEGCDLENGEATYYYDLYYYAFSPIQE